MSENVDELKEMEKKKLDAAFDTYNGVVKEESRDPAVPLDGERSRRPRQGSGDPNLGVLLITAGILLFLIFRGILPSFGIWGWLLAGWLMFSVLKGKRGSCRW